MSLVLLTLAAVLLASLARYSMSTGSRSYDMRQEMQRRWGTVSLSRSILYQADRVLSRRDQATVADSDGAEPPGPIVETVHLGNLDFKLMLDDETRKLNVNQLYAAGGSDGVREALRSLGQGRVGVRLWPDASNASSVAARPFESWGQVYRIEDLSVREHPARWLANNTREVTCWGEGRVHYRRCSDEVLDFVAQQAAGAVTAARLLKLRGEDPSLALDELLSRLAVRQSAAYRLRDRLTDKSDCFSMWFTVEGPDREWHELHVAELTAGGLLDLHRFVW